MTNQLFTDGYGRLALDRFAFRDHVDGVLYKHNADVVTVIPNLTLNEVSVSNVYSALQQIGIELGFLELSGKGFITVGDGFDTYHKSDPEDLAYDPDAPYDAAILAFNTYLDDLLNITDPLDPDYNPLHSRIRSGGVILIKAGTYKFTGTVDVPPGMIILGEGYGTRIINQMASPAPLFKIKSDTSRVPDAGVDATEKFIFAREAMLVNLTIADNFVEPTFLGNLTYKDPINNDSIQPLVALEEGGSLSCENVRFVGKSEYTFGVISDITSFAIKVDSTVPSATGTRLKILNCSIDGFALPIQFTAAGFKNDHFIMSNSLVRGYGFLNADFAAAANNTILKVNTSNVNLSNNYLFGNDDTVTSALYIIPSGAPAVQAIPKVTLTGNNIAVDRTNSAVNTTFRIVRYSADPNADVSVVTTGNNFNGVSYMDSGIAVKVRPISAATYTVDSLSADYMLTVDTSSNAITINLPAHSIGRQLIIADAGNATTNNITLVRSGGTGNIGDYAGSRIIADNWATWTLVSDGTNWYIV